MSDSNEKRLERIIEVLMAYAQQDFTPRLEVSGRLDDIDAVATGINLLAEELDGEVASRKDLVAALASLEAAQDQLVAAEKLAAIGQLASGVAHELNNPSAWVMIALDKAQRMVMEATAIASLTGIGELSTSLAAANDALADVRQGLERMQAVIADLGALSRSQAERMAPLDLDEVVRSACQRARPSFHSIAHLELDLGGPPPVIGDRARLAQVVTNLVVNAAHAVSDRPAEENRIVVRTLTDAGGAGVLLVVEDNGPGIDAALRERVFEPYFTTKPADVGTGLGLAIVRRITERHGGSVSATTAPGGGARIEVRLPLAGPVATSRDAESMVPAAAAGRVLVGAAGVPRATSAGAPLRTPPGGISVTTIDSPVEPFRPEESGELPAVADTSLPPALVPDARRPRVLLVDDEPLLLKTIAQALADECDVATALGGEAALALLATDRDFDAVLCDLQMPTVDGAAVYAAIEASAPALLRRIVIMSGGAVTPRARQFLDRVRPRVLSKPLSIDDTIELMHRLAGHARG